MATLAAINSTGGALGDVFDSRPVIRVIADGNYVYGEKESTGALGSTPIEYEVLYDGSWGTGRSLSNGLTWDTVKAEFAEIHLSLRFGATPSAFAGAIPTDELTGQRGYRYGQDDAERAVFTFRTPFTSGLFDAVATSLSSANQVIIRGRKRKQFSAIEYAELPTSMGISSVSGNQTGNGFVSNAVYRSNNTGPLQNTGFGNWTWRVKATRIGDWIQHMYWNDTANIAFRESYDGGATWTSWAA